MKKAYTSRTGLAGAFWGIAVLVAILPVAGATPPKGGKLEREGQYVKAPKTPAEIEARKNAIDALKPKISKDGCSTCAEVFSNKSAAPSMAEGNGLLSGGERLESDKPPALSERDYKAIDRLSQLVARTDSLQQLLTDPLLAENPWQNDPSWQSLSVKDQLTWLAKSAQSQSHQNAEKLLAVLSRQLAQNHATAAYDPALKRYLKIPTLPPPVAFPKLNPSSIVAGKLSAAQEGAIGAIANYCERTPLSITELTSAASLPADKARAIRESLLAQPMYGTNMSPALLAAVRERNFDSHSALRMILHEASDPKAALRGIVRYVAERYRTAAYDPVLSSYLPN